MPIKQTIPTNSSDSLQFGNATTPVAAQVTGAEVSTGNGYLAMSTTASGTVTERARIDSAGNLLINQTSADTGAKLSVTGGIKGTITSGTAQNTTSGTSITFSSIPSWVKRITVMFNGVSTNGTSNPLIQIGSGSVTTTGYVASAALPNQGGTTAGATYTTGFGVSFASATNNLYGHMVITLLGSNLYVSSHCIATNTTGAASVGGGSVTLSGTLDRVVITTVNGTDTFDAGSVNIFYEG